MGITLWQDRQVEPVVSPEAVPVVAPEQTGDQWQLLQQTVKNCTLCNLCRSRTRTVFGVGDPKADIMFIGEAPGANEDRKGEPFVGRAGHLLDKMLDAFSMKRGDVFISNVLKCRPPLNRDPNAEEVAQCSAYLAQQVAMVQPKLLIALGRVAACYLLGVTTTPLRQLRGQQFVYGESAVPVVVTYHPAYLLRSPRDKGNVFQDLQMAMSIIENNRKSS